ncbi:hypothetical protein CerSpe_278020 [Prunus speciosa]
MQISSNGRLEIHSSLKNPQPELPKLPKPCSHVVSICFGHQNHPLRYKCNLYRFVSLLGSMESMMPLHSAIASARLKSNIAVDSTCWSCLSQEAAVPR